MNHTIQVIKDGITVATFQCDLTDRSVRTEPDTYRQHKLLYAPCTFLVDGQQEIIINKPI